MKRFALISTAFTVTTLSLFAATVSAQAPKPGAPAGSTATATTVTTPTQAYLGYLAALKKATKIEDVLPLITTKMRAEVEKSPAAERVQFFGMMKMMTLEAHTGVKVVKEAVTGSNAKLNVEGLNGDKSKATGTIDLVKEGGAWKVGLESWK